MKRLMILASIVMLALTSCEKDYVPREVPLSERTSKYTFQDEGVWYDLNIQKPDIRVNIDYHLLEYKDGECIHQNTVSNPFPGHVFDFTSQKGAQSVVVYLTVYYVSEVNGKTLKTMKEYIQVVYQLSPNTIAHIVMTDKTLIAATNPISK